MMATFRRLLRFPAAERRALVVAAALQLLFAVLLRAVPIGAVARAVGSSGARRGDAAGVQAVNRWLWALDASGRHLGAASSCLARALGAQWLAGRHGVTLPISIGIARGADGSLAAHAWIAGPDTLCLGAEQAGRYLPLATLDGTARL
jgi:hypothetical protein